MKRGPASIKMEATTTFWSSKMASNSFGGCPSRGSESQVAKKTVQGTKKHYKWTPFWARVLDQESKKDIQKGIQNSMPKNNWNSIPKGSQNDTTIDAKIKDVSNFSKKNEKYEIKLPLGREHDFTDSGHLKLLQKSTWNLHKIYAENTHRKSLTRDTKMEPKWVPKTVKI